MMGEYRLKKDIWVSDNGIDGWCRVFIIKAGTVFEFLLYRGWCPKEENGSKYVFGTDAIKNEEYFEPISKQLQ